MVNVFSIIIIIIDVDSTACVQKRTVFFEFAIQRREERARKKIRIEFD